MKQLYVKFRYYSHYLLAVGLAIAILVIGVTSTKLAKAAAPKRNVITPSVTYRDAPVASSVNRVSKRVQQLHSYLVRAGDTLSSIASRLYGNSNSWPSLWWINKQSVHNPNDIYPGERLKLSGWHPNYGWIYTAAIRAVPHSVTLVVTTSAHRSPHGYRSVAHSNSSVTGYAASPGSYTYYGGTPGGSFGRCVVARESSGNAQVMNSSRHYGLYQFSEPTWVAYGGSPATFGHATVAEQERVFANALARGGESNWSPYDGC